MDLRYKVSLLIYSIVQVFFLLFILLWSLGMSVNAEMNQKHYILIAFIVLNTLVIGFLPAIAKKQNIITKIVKCIGVLFLVVNLVFALNFLFQILFNGFDGGIFTILFLILFSVAATYLIKRIIKL
jgi:hypothetical protein